ncbi:MAG TPA: calcium-binding protein [Tepidisphaeraceae bacterium]|nr:calcium-binding protein [Tepidisphaeraceae bacterium]
MEVAGGKLYTVGDHAIRRHNLGTGTLDAGFDGDGQFDLKSQTVLSAYNAFDVAVSPAGKVAVAGFGTSADATEKKLPQRAGEARPNGAAIVVLDSDGTLDEGFDENGVAFYEGTGFGALLFATDDTIFAANGSPDFQPTFCTGLYEFDAAGSYTFNASNMTAETVTIGRLVDGKIMIAGGGSATRFNAGGTLDTTYSADGSAQPVSPLPNHAELFEAYGDATDEGAALVLPNGGVVLATHFTRATAPGTWSNGPLLLRKLLPQPSPVNVNVNLALDGTLTITGSAGDDDVVVLNETDNQRVRVVINEQSFHFPADSVKRVSAKLRAGGDFFRGGQPAMPIPQFIDGEGGHDTIFGGSGDDTLVGGLDNDLVEGGAGNDSIYGNGGKDVLNGGEGRDRVDGGRSADELRGGAHNDRLIGGDATDIMFGDSGDDLFYAADSTRDGLFGGGGTDRASRDANLDELASIETIVN